MKRPKRLKTPLAQRLSRIATRDGLIDLTSALRLLADRGVTRVFSEGGPRVAESLLAADLADEVILHTAVKPLGRAGTSGADACGARRPR